MDNKWFKLAVVSFVGILVSIFGLYFVQAFGGQDSHSSTAIHQLGGTQAVISHSGASHDPNVAVQGGGLYPQHPTQYPQTNSPGHYNNHQFNNEYLQYQLNHLRYQMNQMMYQMNQIMNNMGTMNNMNMSGGMSGMM